MILLEDSIETFEKRGGLTANNIYGMTREPLNRENRRNLLDLWQPPRWFYGSFLHFFARIAIRKKARRLFDPGTNVFFSPPPPLLRERYGFAGLVPVSLTVTRLVFNLLKILRNAFSRSETFSFLSMQRKFSMITFSSYVC